MHWQEVGLLLRVLDWLVWLTQEIWNCYVLGAYVFVARTFVGGDGSERSGSVVGSYCLQYYVGQKFVRTNTGPPPTLSENKSPATHFEAFSLSESAHPHLRVQY